MNDILLVAILTVLSLDVLIHFSEAAGRSAAYNRVTFWLRKKRKEIKLNRLRRRRRSKGAK